MDTIAVSVVVPVYNGGIKVKKCLQCLDDQDFDKEYEVLIIDDASPDNSVEVLTATISRLKNKSRFKVFTSEKNGRAGAARNRGVELAKGEYVLFIDQDDYPDRSLLGSLYSLSDHGRIDLISCGIGDLRSTELRPPTIAGQITIAQRKDSYMRYGYVFANLIRRQILIDHDIRFPENLMFEDVLYLASLWAHIETYANTKEVLYYRVGDDQSQTSQMNAHKFNDRIDSALWYLDHYKSDKAISTLEQEVQAQAFYYVFESIVSMMLAHEELFDADVFDRCWKLGHEIDPSWDYLFQYENKMSRKRLSLLHEIYLDKEAFFQMAPKERKLSRIKGSPIMQPIKKVYKRLTHRL